MEAEEPNIKTDTWLYFKLLTYFTIRKIVLIVFPDTSQWTFFQRWDKFSNNCCGLKYCSAGGSLLTFLFSWRLDCKLKTLSFCLWWVICPLDCFLVGGTQQRWKFNLNPLKLFRKFCVDVLQYGSRIIIINCSLLTSFFRGVTWQGGTFSPSVFCLPIISVIVPYSVHFEVVPRSRKADGLFHSPKCGSLLL